MRLKVLPKNTTQCPQPGLVPVRLMNVSVSDGGIQSHDMRVLQLLRQICGGTLAASTGLSMVTFVPGDLLPGNFSAEAGRLGYMI